VEDTELVVKFLVRNKADSNEENYQTLLEQVETDAGEEGDKIKVGVFQKEWEANEAAGGAALVSGWQKTLDAAEDVETVDISLGLGLLLAIKDEDELELIKKSAVLGNKILKHGFIKMFEDVIDKDKSLTHEAFAEKMEEIYSDPKKINVNVPEEHIQSAYFPIIQSGGDYDLRVSALSNQKKLRSDIVIVSLGSRYHSYCSNISRTFLVDPPKAVSDTYETLLVVYEACLAAMVPGQPLKSVYAAAVQKLKEEDREDLVKCLPKNLGFAIGVYFREGSLALSPKTNVTFKPGMTFNLSVGFFGIKLSKSDKSAVKDESAVS